MPGHRRAPPSSRPAVLTPIRSEGTAIREPLTPTRGSMILARVTLTAMPDNTRRPAAGIARDRRASQGRSGTTAPCPLRLQDAPRAPGRLPRLARADESAGAPAVGTRSG